MVFVGNVGCNPYGNTAEIYTPLINYNVNINMLPTDPDGDNLNVTLEEQINSGVWNTVYTKNNATQDVLLTYLKNSVLQGNYTYRVTVADPYGATATATTSFTVLPSPLTLSASISPNPAKQGQKITLKIDTTGFVKYLTVYFPYEIYTLDPTTPISITIPEQSSRTDYVPYYLPIKTPLTLDKNGLSLRLPYVIQVKAQRADNTFEIVNVNLNVKGNIYDGIKTEVKNK